MPLSELPIMRALLALPTPLARDQTTRKRAIKEDDKTQLTMLTLKIVDKIQVLALRRPRALIVVAQVIDKLLDEQLELLLERKHADHRPSKTG